MRDINDPTTISKSTFLDHRVAWSTKQSKKWYKPSTDIIIRRAIQQMNYINDLYLAANGEIADESVFNYVLKPFGNSSSEVLKNFKFPGKIREDSIITPVIEKMMGEYVRQLTDVIVISAGVKGDSSFKKDLTKLLSANLAKLVSNELNGVHGMETEQVDVDNQQKIDSFIDNWTSEEVKINQEALDYIRHYTSSDFIYIKGFYDWIVTGRTFTYRTIAHDDIIKKHVPANEYHPIDNGEEYVQKFNGGCWVQWKSINDVVSTFRDDLSNTEIEFITSLYDWMDSGGSIKVPYATMANRSEGFYYKGGFVDTMSHTDNFTIHTKNNFIPVYHTHYSSERKIGIVTYTNVLGEVHQKRVDETYKINKAGGDISIEWMWIKDELEAYRIGPEDGGVYIKPMRVEAQRPELNNIEDVHCAFNGKIGLFANSYNHSIVKRLLPYEILYKIYGLQLERIISKEVNNGRLTIIPKSLLNTTGIGEEKNLYYALADGRLIVDDTVDNYYNKANTIKTVESQLGRIIGDLDRVKEKVKYDGWDSIGWNNQRDGNIQASAGKATTEQAIFRSSLSSIIILYTFDKFMEVDYEADLDFAKLAWDDEDGFIRKNGYIVSDRRAEFLKISAKSFRNSSCGIFVQDRAKVEEQIKYLKDIGFNASQNGNFSIAAEIATTVNPDKIKEYIKEAERLSREYAEFAAKNEQEASAAKDQKEDGRLAAKLKFDKYKVDTEAQVDREKIEADKEIANIKTNDVQDTNTSKERISDSKNSSNEAISRNKQQL